MVQIQIEGEVLEDLDRAARLEWLEANGIGGFASSSVLGMNTRRYHGLLVAAANPPVGRFVALSRLEETLCAGPARYALSCNRYAGAVHPEGYRYLARFRLRPFPTFAYRVGELGLEKQVFMVHGENTTVVTYGPAPAALALEVRPLIAYRDYHTLTRENPGLNPHVEVQNGFLKLAPYAGMPALYLAHNAERFDLENHWYYNFEYVQELHRGLDAHEDLHCPGCLRFALQPGESAHLIASLEARRAGEAEGLRETELARRQRAAGAGGEDFEAHLRLAADAFLVKRRDGLSTVVAGYPWFTDWGRDTMIALPGLTLVTGRYAEARSILEAYAGACDRGMIPNRTPDGGGAPDYNTVDATLWFFHAVDRYVKYTGDLAFVRERLWQAMVDVVRWHLKGTRYGIRVDADGLLRAGEPGVQLTWMDARVGDWVVTPRHGKPVEVNALWYNALRVMQELAHAFEQGERAPEYRALALKARRSFAEAFWNAEAGCLYDVVDGPHRDGAVRPNQVFALSLPHRMLPGERERRVLEVVERELVTPLGLRSLSAQDPAYRGYYGGDQHARDGAYHQGTVWAWPIGAFVKAWVRLHGGTRAARQEAMKFLSPFRQHLCEAGLGQISEIFDGDAPHTPRGCFAQAWSVAEVLRAYAEDILGRRPRGRIAE